MNVILCDNEVSEFDDPYVDDVNMNGDVLA